MKTTFTYDHYFDYEEVTKCFKYFETTYPDYVNLESICTTEENKHVWAITLTNKKTGNALDKPAFYMDGNHHAGEVTGSMACMHFVDTILNNYLSLLDTKTIYVIPKVSPDGSDCYLHTATKLRSVNRLYLEHEPGLHALDMNNDGIIAMMRVQSKYGAWKVSEKNPLVMTKRLPDDVEGTFYNVYTEGFIDQYDGFHISIAKPDFGLDFNRNYPFGWFVESRQPGAGKYPLSNPENKAVADFVIAHKNIGSVLTMHTTGGVLVYPPGTKPSSQASPKDMQMFKEIGQMATKEMGYPVVNIFDAFLTDTENYSSGAFDDWCYHTQGIPAYTVELWNVKERSGCPEQWPVKYDKTNEEKEEEYTKVLNWIQENSPESILPWKEFEHPQLGKVEIGGVDFKFTCQNCPNAFLLQEVEKTTKFALRYVNVLPSVSIDDVKVEKLDTHIYKVEAIIGNNGYLPTYICEEAKNIEVDKDLQVSCSGNVISVQGDIKQLAGFSNINTEYSYDGISTSNSDLLCDKITWIVSGNVGDEIEIKVVSQKAGIAVQNISLS